MDADTNTDNEYTHSIFWVALENGGSFKKDKKYHLELSRQTMSYIMAEDQTVQPITGLVNTRPFRYNTGVPFRQVWDVDEDGETAMRYAVSNSLDFLDPDDIR